MIIKVFHIKINLVCPLTGQYSDHLINSLTFILIFILNFSVSFCLAVKFLKTAVLVKMALWNETIFQPRELYVISVRLKRHHY